MKGGGGKQEQSVFPTFQWLFNFFSVEPIHKYIYVLYVNRTHFTLLYMSSRAFSGFQITKINKIYNSLLQD